MATILKDLDEVQYPIKSVDKNIKLSAVFGDGQKAGYLIFLDLELVGTNEPTSFGNKQEIGNKQALLSATLTDALVQTNWVSMTVFIQEGDDEKLEICNASDQVPNEKDSIVYTLPIKFL
jgi:hypothetical protein